MKDYFSRPSECISRQEATAAFENLGLKGKIDIGVVETSTTQFMAWSVTTNNHAAIIPVFRSFEKQTLDVAKFYSVDEFYIFFFNNKIYCIDKGEVYRIDMLFCETLAARVASIMIDEDIEAAGLLTVCPPDDPQTANILVWAWSDAKGIPHLYPVFEEDEVLLSQTDGLLATHFYNPGDIFEKNGLIWQITDGEDGLELSPLLVDSNIYN